MSKNKKPKAKQQLLSPENYIRQKAKNLPIYECLVNENWKEEGLVHVHIARQHSNGNITHAFYLVDLYCLGVKDTGFRFNDSISEYEELRERMDDNENFVQCSYALAHNIVYAGWIYGEELGFKQHKEFVFITQFMLEDDTDEIEFIDIECGKEGRPFLIRSNFMLSTEFNKHRKHLEAKFGEDGFEWADESNEEFDDYEEDEEDEDNVDYKKIIMESLAKIKTYSDYFLSLTAEERRNEFEVYFASMRSNEANEDAGEDFLKLNVLTDIITLNDIYDKEEASKLQSLWKDELNIEVTEEPFTIESLGLNIKQKLTDELIKDIEFILFDIEEELEEEAEDIDDEEFQRIYIERSTIAINNAIIKYGDIPYFNYLKLNLLGNNVEKLKTKLMECLGKYPDYPIFKILYHIHAASEVDEGNEFMLINDIFNGRKMIVKEEMHLYQTYKANYISRNNSNNIMQLTIAKEMLDKNGLDIEQIGKITPIYSLAIIMSLKNIFDNQKHIAF